MAADAERLTGRFTSADRIASAWHYLPAQISPGTSALRVTLSYDRGEGAVLDLGCLGPGGFRGWSGGARSWFGISATDATPGYLPGELEPGLWQVMIGLHKVPANGVDYDVTLRTWRRAGPGLAWGRPSPPPAPSSPADRPPRRLLPAGPGRTWLAGDLHTHTVHSDGALTVPELAEFAVRRGLDFLAVTDHNTISHHAELPLASARYGITLLPGQEITTSGGHAGALGDVGWIDFRAAPDQWLETTSKRGGLLSVNHPIAGPDSWIRPMRGRPPLVEVWHWSWLDPRWTTPLAWWLAWDPDAIPVGGSDWHRDGSDAPPGQPTTWVECSSEPDPVSPHEVLAGLRGGRVAISAERDGPVLLQHDGELIAVDGDGLVLHGPDGPRALVSGDLARFPVVSGHHRLVDPAGRTLALCPVRE